jgi:predicted nucleic acid-binding protein
MQIIVSDTCCMIDLMKAALLEEMLRLPYDFVMPGPLFNDEWLSLDNDTKDRLRALGLEVRDLPGTSVRRAQSYFNENRGLKLNDCFALVLAEDTDESMLLTGDGRLRTLAENNDVEVHGVLWITDELEEHGIVAAQRLHDALCLLRDDVLVFLPEDELARRIRRLARLL